MQNVLKILSTKCNPQMNKNKGHTIYIIMNQLEKLEAAKAARLVCLSLLSLTGSFLVLLGPSGSFWVNFY